MPLGSAEVTERDAPPEISRRYADLKSLMDVGMVNLIYRRMAAEPGLFEWTHATLRPLFADGSFQAAAAQARAETEFPGPIAIPVEARRVVGIDAAADRQIIAMLDDYNHGNSYNLFALSALHHFLVSGDADTRQAEPSEIGDTIRNSHDLPPIIAMTDMAPETAALIEAMSAPIAPPDRPMIPSLLRHLAHWPAFLSLTATAITPWLRAGAINQTANALQDRARAAAPAFASRLASAAAHPPPVGAARDDLAANLIAYTSRPIPIMVAIGEVIRTALD